MTLIMPVRALSSTSGCICMHQHYAIWRARIHCEHYMRTWPGRPIVSVAVVITLTREACAEASIHIGNLPQGVTDGELLAPFQAKFQTAHSAHVVVDQTTGAQKGFGFVRFRSEAERDTSLQQLQGLQLRGHSLRLSAATPRPARGAAAAPSGAMSDVRATTSLFMPPQCGDARLHVVRLRACLRMDTPHAVHNCASRPLPARL